MNKVAKTIEKCIKITNNKFETVLLAACRAAEIESGTMNLTNSNSKKSTVIALEEIAEGKVCVDQLRSQLINKISREIFKENVDNYFENSQQDSENNTKSSDANSLDSYDDLEGGTDDSENSNEVEELESFEENTEDILSDAFDEDGNDVLEQDSVSEIDYTDDEIDTE